MTQIEQKIDTIIARLPFLKEAPAEFFKEFVTQARLQKIPAGTTVFWEGDACHSLALLLSGTVRVFKTGENGREITLYRFGAGEGCILTASCIMQGGDFPAIAEVERDAEAVIIPASILKNWVHRYEIWREFVLGLLAQRLSNVIATVEEIAFRRMDARLAEWLQTNQSKGNSTIRVTHHKIAEELGTAREVVSRLLKDFETKGLIRLARGEIEIHLPAQLKQKMK